MRRTRMLNFPQARSRARTALAVPASAAGGFARASRRGLEILPPLLVWVAITAPAWAAIVAPGLLGSFLVAFSAYWLWRSLEFVAGLVLGVYRLWAAKRRDWAAEASAHLGYPALRHLVILPTYKESTSILADTLQRLARQSTPLDRIAVVLAFEERDPEAPRRARALTERFGSLFGEWLVTFHPDVPGEVKGKSSNLAWAARRAQAELIDTGRLDPERLLVTVCDADSRLHGQYLAALAHHMLADPHGKLHIFQPAILFYANHWRLPAALRAINSVFSLYSLARLAASHRLVPQSTYSLSWNAAHAVGFWDVDVIPEDSHMFFKVWLQLGRHVRARAIYLPVYADAAEGPTLARALSNHYQQIRRWAWGVSDVPYLVLGALRATHIPWYLRLARVGWYVEEHLVWPAHWFILTLGGLVPPLLNSAYAATEMAIWQASAISTLLSFGMPALAVAIIADLILRPRPPERVGWLGSVLGLAGFAVLPVTGLALAALPALDAHTRLLFGRSLAYQVTEKLPLGPASLDPARRRAAESDGRRSSADERPLRDAA